MNKQIRKFGRWPSDVSAGFVAGKMLRFQTVQAFDDRLYWTESRPCEKGRAVLCCLSRAPSTKPSAIIDLLPAPYSVRSKVHEYGGGAFLVTNDVIFFINADDQQIWSIDHRPGVGQPLPIPRQITHAPAWCFADLCYDISRNRLICVGEHHSRDGSHPENLLVSIELGDGDKPKIIPLIKGSDFYASPRLSPDGRQLAFVNWDLPSMPWEAARLQIAHLDEQGAITRQSCPNQAHSGASFQPEWDQRGDLWFINDESGYGQLYRLHEGEITLFAQAEAEMGDPLWVFGMKTYGFLENGDIAVLCRGRGKAWISLIDPADKSVTECPGLAEAGLSSLDQLVTLKNEISGIFSWADKPGSISSISAVTGEITTHKTSINLELDVEQISIAKPVEFKNALGQTVYGNYYPPSNRDFEGPANELPPVILTAHGGPTAFSNAGLTPKVQYWTSRGFGYFDVNYGGSWGFGKAYRQRLDGQWGIADVADMVAAANYLVTARLANPARLLISGSSAGGYSVLMALVKSDLFAAGASYYGISDLGRLHDSTHKFEAGYLNGLLGLTEANRARILKERSPLFSADHITAPVIFFQGLQDKIVPPDQARMMVDALEKNGIQTIYQTFTSEGHGFRAQQAIETALTMEYDFYSDILTL